MPTFSPELEGTLHRAIANANARQHEFASGEHLLYALVDDVDAKDALIEAGSDRQVLKRNLLNLIAGDTFSAKNNSHEDAKPTREFQLIVQQAVQQKTNQGLEVIDGADLLLSIRFC